MAKIVLKRKCYGLLGGVADAGKDMAGRPIRAVGGLMNSGIGKLVGGWAGVKFLGPTLGSLAGSISPMLSLPTRLIGGWVAGKQLMSGLGNGLKNIGGNMQM